MEQMNGKTLNIVDENIEKLKQIFPEVFNEDKVDFEKLEVVLGEYKDNGIERYNFSWPGKSKAIRIAQTPSTGTLRPCKEESKNWDDTENLYIEGDNLEVLKLLQKSYSNKVKMIYIDPPYNTGNDFVYKDDFKDNIENYFKVTGQKDEEGIKTTTNTESSGRYHSNWINMMYPRLKLARNLLKDDGVIFISIDDCEVTNLKQICDEVLGENNFIAKIIRNTNSSKNQSLFVSVSHEYCLIYSKNIEKLQKKHAEMKWAVPKNNIKEYEKKVLELRKSGLSNNEISEELKILTKYPRFIDFTNYWYIDRRGVYQKGDLGGVKNGNNTAIMNPKTKRLDDVPPGGFRYTTEKLNKLIGEERIHFHSDGSLPRIKRYLSENMMQRPKSIMSDDQRPDNSLLKALKTPFDNPKQMAFMKRILNISDKDSIILDFFSGSGTTANAVIELNIEENANRKFIMVQLPEIIGKNIESYKMGYRNICEIGKERIRRAGEKIREENKGKEGIEDLDIGFKVFKLDSSNINKWDAENIDNLEKNLLTSVENIKTDRTEEDVLYEVLLKYGIDLNMPIEEHNIAGKKVFDIGFGAIIACLDENITLDVVEGIGKLKNELEPDTCRVVFMDNGFESDSVKTNAIQILKQYKIDDVKSI